MTPDQILALRDEAERLLKDITPGPWAWEAIAEKSNEWAVGQAWDESGQPIEGEIVGSNQWVEDAVIERRLVGMNESGHANFADARFIAAAPRLVRQLLDALKLCERELTVIRDAARSSLSDGVVRAVASGLDEPIAEDIEWAAGELSRVPPSPALPTDVQAVIAEMTEALCQGAFINPEKFGWMLKPGDNPILRWRDTLQAAFRQSVVSPVNQRPARRDD